MHDQDERHEQREERRLASDHRAEVVLGQPGDLASVMIGIAIAPNATGAVSATSATAAALIGLKPSAISITAQIATGRAEAGERLEQRAEAERDDHRLDALVVGDARRTTAAAPRSARSRPVML